MRRLLITCVTWNIHRAVGQDGKRDPMRVAGAIEGVLAAEKLDILALQEADEECPPHAGIIDVAGVSRSVNLTYQHDEARLRWGPASHGFLGTILWANPKFARIHADVIDLPGHCHRGVIAAEFAFQGATFRVISGHFSLSQPLRIVQMRILGQYMARRPAMQTILLGDLNEWRPWGGYALSKQMLGSSFRGPVLRSFPTKRPLLPLDRILTNAGGQVIEARVVNAEPTNKASDHCPLFGRVEISNAR